MRSPQGARTPSPGDALMAAPAGPAVRVSGYRWVTLALLAVHGTAVGLGALGRLDVPAAALVATVAAVAVGTLLTSLAGAALSRGHAHLESSLITGLILGLVLRPDLSADALLGALAVGAAAGASKVLVRARGRHLLNPAAAGAVVAGTVVAPVWGVASPVWWAATPLLAPVVLLAGLVVVRRTRAAAVAAAYVVAHLGVAVPWRVLSGASVVDAAADAVLAQPVLLVAAFLVVEPLTQPPRRGARIAVAALVGVVAAVPSALWAPASPEVAILVGNMVTALVAAPRAARLVVVGHREHGPGVHEVLLRPARPLRWQPGERAEIDVGRTRPDGQGRRRVLPLVPAGPGAVSVAITVRERPSAFERALCSAPVGRALRATHVGGDLLLPRDPTTPVLMVADAGAVSSFVGQLEHGGPRDMVLVVVCSDGMPPPYLRRIARTRARVVVVAPDPVPHLPPRWTWYLGTRLTVGALESAMSDLARRHAYVVGTPDAVRRARDLLAEAGVRRVRSEEHAADAPRPAHRSGASSPAAGLGPDLGVPARRAAGQAEVTTSATL